MTEAMVDDALVEVTSEDREAAIRHLERTGRSREELCGAKIRSGEWDHTEDVQAFARHRLAGVAAGREEAAKVADYFKDQSGGAIDQEGHSAQTLLCVGIVVQTADAIATAIRQRGE